MAAGAPGAASGKGLLSSVRAEPVAAPVAATARDARAGDGAGQAASEAQARREDAAAAGRTAASEADGRAQARSQDGADAADSRSGFAAALDKARGPAQSAPRMQGQARQAAQQAAQQSAQQATNSTAISAAAEAAAAAQQALVRQAIGAEGTQETPDAATGEDKAGADGGAAGDAHGDSRGDPLGAASAAVASLLGWLQPVQAASGQHAPRGDRAGDGAGGEEDGNADGAGIDGIRAMAAAGAVGGTGGSGQAGATTQASAPGQEQGGGAGAAGIPATAGDAGALASTDGPPAGQSAGRPGDGSGGALAYATRYGEGKASSGPVPGSTTAQAPGFDAGQSIRASAAALAAPVERSVPAPMGDRHWARALSTQVLLLANHRIESATLRLSPEHTGPVEVRIQMQDSAVSLAFNATQADTRAALEQALPQLRAAFSGAGLALGQATVGQQMRQGSQFSHGSPNADGLPADHPEATAAIVRPLGLLDEYA